MSNADLDELYRQFARSGKPLLAIEPAPNQSIVKINPVEIIAQTASKIVENFPIVKEKIENAIVGVPSIVETINKTVPSFVDTVVSKSSDYFSGTIRDVLSTFLSVIVISILICIMLSIAYCIRFIKKNLRLARNTPLNPGRPAEDLQAIQQVATNHNCIFELPIDHEVFKDCDVV